MSCVCTSVSTVPIAAKPAGSERPKMWCARTDGGRLRDTADSTPPLASITCSRPATPADRSTAIAFGGPSGRLRLNAKGTWVSAGGTRGLIWVA